MGDIDSTLWALERQFWLGGVELYRDYLADTALLVFPGMVLTKAQTVASIASGPRWTSVSFADTQLVRLTSETVALVYRASGSRDRQEAPYVALVSSVYVERDGDWRLVLHQQSPGNESG